MPLLTRQVGTPLTIDIGPGAVAGLGPLLADRRISSGGHVAVIVGPGLGEEVAATLRPQLENGEIWGVVGGSVQAGADLAVRLRAGFYDAVVGIGGGRTIDSTKYAATLAGIPMVSVATNLSHDGICSPTASLEHDKGKGSFGVTMPIAVIVDLDYVRAAPQRLVRAGVGDVISNFSAVDDWILSGRETGEPIDRLALTLARTAAEALVYQPRSIESDEFLTVLAEGLVLSGMAMSFAGSSRPASGGDHEIMHAIDHLFPGTANHGELAGIGAAFCYHLRARFLGEGEARLEQVVHCLDQHGLPRLPGDVGLTDEQFAEAVSYAPKTRPGRVTILEHLDLSDEAVRDTVADYVRSNAR
jgi:glycerol-1-phosphate dehydrogenase [NAD(P)+]